MNAATFRSFARTAIDLQADDDTPGDYVMVKAAVAAKYGLRKLAWNSGELAGLGILAAPAAANLTGRPLNERHKDVAEVTGLGMLAAPYAHNVAVNRSARYAGSGIGQRLGKIFSH